MDGRIVVLLGSLDHSEKRRLEELLEVWNLVKEMRKNRHASGKEIERKDYELFKSCPFLYHNFYITMTSRNPISFEKKGVIVRDLDREAARAEGEGESGSSSEEKKTEITAVKEDEMPTTLKVGKESRE